MKKVKVILMALTAVVLAAGTIVEKFHNNEYATEHLYGAWWFYILLGLVAAGALHSIVKEKLWKKPHLLLVYSSVVLILLGGALTASTGKHGSVTLHPGQPVNSYTTYDGEEQPLPFAVTLEYFRMVPYPGTRSPMDFESHIRMEQEQVVISMNNIYKRGGYRFYQEDFDDEGGSILSVAHDPLGIAVTYAGYIVLILGLLLMFFLPQSRFRKLLRGSALLLLLTAGTAAATAAPHTLSRASAEEMGRLYVLYKGRICPLQTLAKDFTTKLCGNATYEGLTSEQVFSGWLYFFSEWSSEPMIKIKGAELRSQLGTEGRYASFDHYLAHQELFESHHPMSKELRAANEKFNLVKMLYSGELLKIFPLADSSGAVSWYAQNSDLPFSLSEEEYLFIRKQQSYCQELAWKGDDSALCQVFRKTRTWQERNAASVLPPQRQIGAERLYNALTTGKWLAMAAITLGLLLFAVSLFRYDKKDRALTVGTFVIVASLTAFLSLIFILRWIAGGHVPMAGGFDSMNLMAIAIGVITLLATRRFRIAPFIGLLTMGFCLLVAMMSGSNPPVTHLMPVLSSPLLTLHVTVIMISYALFFFVMLNGVAGLALPSRGAELKRVSLLMLYPAVALLALGIIIGAVWANISWGNYWSWDPKEVWALITLIVYLYPLSRAGVNGRERGFHLYCLLAFLSVIVTYFGVNFILGGIHAYN